MLFNVLLYYSLYHYIIISLSIIIYTSGGYYTCYSNNTFKHYTTTITMFVFCVRVILAQGGHANILCIVPMLTDDPRRESDTLLSYFGLF